LNGSRKVFKLAYPLDIKRQGSYIVITDGTLSNTLPIEEWQNIHIKNVDSDGFIFFQLEYAKPKELTMSPVVEAGVNGYTLFYSSVPKARAYGTSKSLYEYYKRERDSSYYALIKREGSKTKKISLGSLQDQNSRIYQMMYIIWRSFRSGERFDRKKLVPFLPSRLASRRILKCVLDILTAEGFLERKERELRGHMHEEFIKTNKLERIMFDPRSSHKTNLESIG